MRDGGGGFVDEPFAGDRIEEILRRGNRRLTADDCALLASVAMREPPARMRRIVEIGAMDGCSTLVLGTVARGVPGAHVWSVEPNPKGRWERNVREFGLEGTVTLVRAWSPFLSESDFEAIGEPIDFLFIDGDHRTRWVLADYHVWSPRVRQGGLVAFHDWTGAGATGRAVRRAVEIILEDDPLREVGRVEGRDRGTIVFRKAGEPERWPAEPKTPAKAGAA